MATYQQRVDITDAWLKEFNKPVGDDDGPYLAAYTFRELTPELHMVPYASVLERFVADSDLFDAFACFLFKYRLSGTDFLDAERAKYQESLRDPK